MAKRSSGEGMLRERKDGRWEGRIVIGYNDKGFPITKNVTAKDKHTCEEKLKKIKEEYSKSTVKTEKDISYGEWIDYWYVNFCKPTIKATTQEGYENSIYKHIIPSIGDIPLKDLDQKILQQFYNDLKNIPVTKNNGDKVTRADSFIRRIHSICFSSLKKAVELGKVEINSAKNVKIPPKKAKEMTILSKDEIYRFMIQAKEYGLYEFFLLELSTGMRRGEILGLQWDDIDLTTGQLNINRQICKVKGRYIIDTPKTHNSIRTLVIPQKVCDVLKQYRENTNSNWVFPSPVKIGEPRNPGSIKTALNRILERSECKHIRFHDLRHTFVTMALENNMDIKTLSGIIGHASSRTTLDVYAHTNDAMLVQAANKIERGIVKSDESIYHEKNNKPYEPFVAKKGKYRKPGTGCLSQINDHLFEGRFSIKNAEGKKISRNVYAKTREECEEKLAELIVEMKEEQRIQNTQYQLNM